MKALKIALALLTLSSLGNLRANSQDGPYYPTSFVTFALNPATACVTAYGLTFSAVATVFVSNNGTKVLDYAITTVGTAPTNTNVVHQQLAAGSQVCLSAQIGSLSSQDLVLWTWNDTAETVTSTCTVRW